MKGISTVLAVILIVIIVVALVGLTYTFAVTLFGTAAGGAQAQAEEVTKRLQKSITFVGAGCNSTHLYFTIRHTGATYDIIGGDLSAFVDGGKVTTTPDIEIYPSGNTTTGYVNLAAGAASEQFTYASTFSANQEVKISISAPAATVDKSITCTS